MSNRAVVQCCGDLSHDVAFRVNTDCVRLGSTVQCVHKPKSGRHDYADTRAAFDRNTGGAPRCGLCRPLLGRRRDRCDRRRVSQKSCSSAKERKRCVLRPSPRSRRSHPRLAGLSFLLDAVHEDDTGADVTVSRVMPPVSLCCPAGTPSAAGSHPRRGDPRRTHQRAAAVATHRKLLRRRTGSSASALGACTRRRPGPASGTPLP